MDKWHNYRMNYMKKCVTFWSARFPLFKLEMVKSDLFFKNKCLLLLGLKKKC